VVSAQPANVPRPEDLPDQDLPGLLEQFDARQALHVTHGSALKDPALKQRLIAGLVKNEKTHFDVLERHFVRHLKPLTGNA
jgi:hypothetical protein